MSFVFWVAFALSTRTTGAKHISCDFILLRLRGHFAILVAQREKQIVYKAQKHMPAKINLELSGYWPASGVLRLNFKGIGQDDEREKKRKRERERRRKRERGETWEQRPD